VIPFDLQSRTRIVFGPGAIGRLGELAAALHFKKTLLVSDKGILTAGHVDRAAALLQSAGIDVVRFHDFGENPDTAMIAAGRDRAADARIDSIIGLGGGSSLDCAKGINFLLTQGGAMRDYRGFGHARQPMLPMIGVPTTAGTGSEAQSVALISDADTHEKMACGDPKAAFRVAILDPEVTISQPSYVTAVTGYDAISHATEAYVTRTHNPLSDMYARHAWRLLDAHYERVLEAPGDLEARAAMQIGAYLAGAAIDLSMLGAAHACANPLTAHYGTTHGVAIATMLPHVVRWNAEVVGDRYADLLRGSVHQPQVASADALANRLERLAAVGGLTREGAGGAGRAGRDEIEKLAIEATQQMTASHNPRPLDVDAARALYECAFQRG
jgi:alcohol dehydrogenase class IV